MVHLSPAKVFEALADPVRRGILELVAVGEQPTSVLLAKVRERSPISQPAVSQHLKVLREAGLVRARAEGTRRIYTLDPVGVTAAQQWLTALLDPLAHFSQPLDALATEVARGKRERRRERPAEDNPAELGPDPTRTQSDTA